MNTATERTEALREAYGVKADALSAMWDQARDGNTYDLSRVENLLSPASDTQARLNELKGFDSELNDIAMELDKRDTADKARAASEQFSTPAALPAPVMGARKSIGQQAIEHSAFQQMSATNWSVNLDVLPTDVIHNAVVRTGAGFNPWEEQERGITPAAVRELNIFDIVPIRPIATDTVQYVTEDAPTNAASVIAEATAVAPTTDALPDAAIVTSRGSMAVATVGVFVPVTEEQLADASEVAALVDDRLSWMVSDYMQNQIINGTGSGGQLTGTLAVTGIGNIAKAADEPTFDTLMRGFTNVRWTGRARPNALFINPLDWQELRLLRTGDGIYILGNPDQSGPSRIWGVPVVQTDALTAGTALTGDYRAYSVFRMRRGLVLESSDSHGRYFTNFLIAIRASMRGAMVHYRPAAFAQITGI